MRLFQGCKRADEVAMTRRGANQHEGKGLTSVLVAKAATTPAPEVKTPPENSDMDAAELAKAQRHAINTILTMDDVQKAHYLGLDETAQTAFLAKSADERKTEADTAKAAKDGVAAAEAAKSAGLTAKEAETSKALEDTRKELEAIKAERAADRQEAELSKRAREEFAGYPGGEVKVVELLKAYSGLPEAARIASENVLKSQAALAQRTTSHLGLLSEDEAAKSAPAHAELAKAAKDHMAANPAVKSLEAAKGAVLLDPKNADLYARVSAEENAGRAALN